MRFVVNACDAAALFGPPEMPPRPLWPSLVAGSRVKFKEGGQRYTVVGRNARFLVCTKPFSARRTYLYTIVDLVAERRGPDHWTLGKCDCSTPSGVAEALAELASGENGLSRRRSIKLRIELEKTK